MCVREWRGAIGVDGVGEAWASNRALQEFVHLLGSDLLRSC